MTSLADVSDDYIKHWNKQLATEIRYLTPETIANEYMKEKLKTLKQLHSRIQQEYYRRGFMDD